MQSSRSLPPRRTPRLRSLSVRTGVAALAAALIALAALGCRDTFRLAGTSPTTAEVRVAQLFEGVADRYDDALITPRYELARVRISQAALTPSKIFDDTAV
ncbi:MAG: hypothetical protein ACREMU_04320, partial [Gemmatimonadaceae bacterium]